MNKIVTLLLFLSLNAAGAEVIKFDPRPATVVQDGSDYVGILLSEEDFRKMLQEKIETNAKISECSVDKRVCIQIHNIHKSSILKLEEQLKKNNSWFERNRGTIGIMTGLTLGAALSVGIVQAVYQR